MASLRALVLHAITGLGVAAAASTNPSDYAREHIIRKDVVVIGGGSSGTYGAIALKDLGKDILVIEKDAHMGGHASTWNDPVSGAPVDFGVQAYWNKTVALDFFKRFNIPVIQYHPPAGASQYLDFATGQALPNFTFTFSLDKYAKQLDRWPALSWGYNIPQPVPEELLMPFGDWLIKHNLQDEVWTMNIFLGGVANPADVLQTVTLNMLIWLGRAYTEVALGNDFTTEKPHHSNGELFARAQAELEAADSVLLSSTVIAADRTCRSASGGVCLAVKTPKGIRLVLAKKLLVSIPPVPWNMIPFGLDRNELALFNKFTYSGYYAGLVSNTGLQAGTNYWNAAVNKTYNLPHLPGSYMFSPTNVDGVLLYWYGSPTLLSQKEVEKAVAAEIGRLGGSTKPTFPAFSDHSPFKLSVGAEDIKKGFYTDLLGLQGKKNTWYTGAAFVSHNSVVLWNYTSILVPEIVKSLA